MNTRSKFNVAVLCTTLFLTLHCTMPSSQDEAGNISQTGNGRVAGILYVVDGSTPARNAIVTIRPRTALADTTGLVLGKRFADTATVTTDDSGKFEFDSTLDTGTYVIEANQGDTGFAIIDSVLVTDEDSIVEVADTLKPAGSITGTIHLSEGGDVRKVFILAFGINRFAVPDTDGVFSFDTLAEGKYDLRIVSSLDDYDVLDTSGVPVVSEEVTDLDTLRLPFTGIPTPENLTAVYDTLSNEVALNWETADPSLVYGYNVLRRNGTTGQYVAVNTALVTDIFFTDSPENEIKKGETYQYIIRATDADENEGLNSQEVTVRIAFFVDAGKDTTYQLGDSVVLQARVDTATIAAATEYRFDVDGNGEDEFVSATEHTFTYAYADTGVYRAVVSIEGDGGNYSDTVEITIVAKDTSGAPSAPQGLSLAYDTLLQIVTLTWRANAESDVAGYNVYRQHEDSGLVKINAAVVADTVFRDSTALQDQAYTYQVKAVDVGGNEGVLSEEVVVEVVGAFVLSDTIGSGIFQGYQIIAVSAAKELYVADILDSVWSLYVYGTDLVLRTTIDSVSAKRPYDLEIDSAGNIYLMNQDGIVILDSGGAAVDTLTDFANNENKQLILSDSGVFFTSGVIGRYDFRKDTIKTTIMISADGLVRVGNMLYVGGQINVLRVFGLNLTLELEWPLDFENNELPRLLQADEQGLIYVFGYHFNPNHFTILVYDSNRELLSRFALSSNANGLELVGGKIIALTDDGILVYE